MRTLGIDLGGYAIKHALLEHDGDARLVSTGEIETRRELGPDGVLARIASVARDVAARTSLDAVGLAMPGPLDLARGRAMRLANFPGWDDVPVVGILEREIGLPVALVRDACAFVLAEHRLGAGRGGRDLVGVTIGTGVGGGLVLDGRLYVGTDGWAGEIGHQTVDPDGPECGCGNHGCVEAYACGPAIARAAGTATAAEAAEAARAGDPRASAAFERAGTYLGIGLANIAAILAPQRIVVGGGVAEAGDLLLAPARTAFSTRLTLYPVAIVEAELGPGAGAIGAALAAAESVREST